jgi:hypothetical protein
MAREQLIYCMSCFHYSIGYVQYIIIFLLSKAFEKRQA